MKKQAGFTLIELVIVIIILGILAATAVPKFVDLQGDARSSAMKGVKGALEGAATLTYSRAAIDGNEKEATETANDVAIAYGYPRATSEALGTAAGLSSTDWDFDATPANGIAIMASGVDYSGTASEQCQVIYTEVTTASGARPTIEEQTDGC